MDKIDLYAKMFSQAREQQKNKQNIAIEEKNMRIAKLIEHANEFIQDLQDMYDILCKAYDNGYVFCEGPNFIDGGRTRKLDECIGYAFTDGINHKLGFYNPNYSMSKNDKPSCLKIGYKGGGCNGDDVYAIIINDTLSWQFGSHDQERYLSCFIDEFPKFKEQFYADIEKKFSTI